MGNPKPPHSQGDQQLALNNQQGLVTSGCDRGGRGSLSRGIDNPSGSSSNPMEIDEDDQTPALYLHQGVNNFTLAAKGSEQ